MQSKVIVNLNKKWHTTQHIKIILKNQKERDTCTKYNFEKALLPSLRGINKFHTFS